MSKLVLDGQTFKTLVTNGCQSLINDIDRINALNVFPVPDGDTGTNMRMTIEGGVKAIIADNEASIGLMAKKLSRAMTMSARGNSGVILSQFFKGLSLGLEEKDEVNAVELAVAFDAGNNSGVLSSEACASLMKQAKKSSIVSNDEAFLLATSVASLITVNIVPSVGF